MNTPSQVRHVGPLAGYMAGYQSVLEARGYKPSSIAHHLQLVAKISRWLESQGLDLTGLTPERIETFFSLRRQRVRFLHTSSHALSGFLEHLDQQGALAHAAPSAPTAIDLLLSDYRRYLLNERGFGHHGAVGRYVQTAREFLGSCTEEGQLDLGGVRVDAVIGFLRAACATCRPGTAKNVAVALRSLLRFLYLEGVVDEPLWKAVPTPGGPTTSALPKSLKAEEVAGLVSSCDRKTVAGRRDFAILMLLTRLGLRAGEVAGLGVDDVNWRTGQLRIRGKGGRVDVLPLPADVGKALEAYIRGGRPRTGGALFRSVLAPKSRLSGTTVTGVVYRACERAGLARAGAHRLRHTTATQMLRGGASLEDIAQILRHAHVATTALYAKVDRVRMAELARPWPGSQS